MMNLLGVRSATAAPDGASPRRLGRAVRRDAVLARHLRRRRRRLVAAPVRVVFLGGLGEIGRNCAAIEVDGRIMLIDCGLMFPDDDMAGVDLVLPDFTYLRENAHRIEGVVATHGHEDHIGALSFLLEEMPLQIIGSPLTIGLAQNRIEERGVTEQATFVEVSDGDRIKVGPFDLEFFPVTHSVPHGFATAFHTPQGVILHSGDFKLDMTPVDGRLTDLAGLGPSGQGRRHPAVPVRLDQRRGGRVLGLGDLDRSVASTICSELGRATDHRRLLRQPHPPGAADRRCRHRLGRTVATLGRSMNNNVALARQMGCSASPTPSFEISKTWVRSRRGTLRHLHRIAGRADVGSGPDGHGDSAGSDVEDGDCVISVLPPDPRQRVERDRVIDGLSARGPRSCIRRTPTCTPPGTPSPKSFEVLHSIVQPEWFMPVHGEYRHMTSHAHLDQMGLKADRFCCAPMVTRSSSTTTASNGARESRRVHLHRRHRQCP